MIKNEKQYKTAKATLAKWLTNRAVHEQQMSEKTQKEWILNELKGAIDEQIKQLQYEIKEYEDIASGRVQLPDLSVVDRIPALLIHWRIAKKITQRQLAVLTGINESLLQKYEAEDYKGAPYSMIARIAHALKDDPDKGKHR